MSLHMSMAASYWQERFENGEQDAAEIRAQFQDMLTGIQKYLAYDYERSDEHLSSVYNDGCLSLLTYNDHSYGDGNPSLLLIPSLINKAHIFDLTEQRSMLRYFCDQGIDAYLLDWGAFLDDPDMQDLDGVVLRKLASAVQFLRDHTGDDLHALGYCMGGSLLAGLAALEPAHLKSLTFIAAPWDFHAGTQDMLNRVKFWSPSLMNSLVEDGNMKVDWLQILFSSLYPDQALKKFSRFAHMEEGSDAADIFVAVEDWLNDGVPLPAGVAKTAVKDWFLGNATVCGQWELDGRAVNASDITLPSFVIASSEDRLVEYETAEALQKEISGAMLHDPKCGHVGMVASRYAVENVWEPIVKWIKQN